VATTRYNIIPLEDQKGIKKVKEVIHTYEEATGAEINFNRS
jgi:hypothetical protein